MHAWSWAPRSEKATSSSEKTADAHSDDEAANSGRRRCQTTPEMPGLSLIRLPNYYNNDSATFGLTD